MKILITGATGFVGKNLVKALLSKHEIHCIVRPNSDISSLSNEYVNLFVYDGNIYNLIDYFKNQKFDGVVHLASFFVVSHTEKDITNLIDSNVKFGTELLEACKQTQVKWFINTGTFWQNYQNEIYNPVNLYAATKEALITIAKYYTQTSDLIFTTVKLNDTFGIGDTRSKIINIWNKVSKTGETLEMSAGEQLIDIVYIDDVVSAYEILIEHLNSDKKEDFKNKEFVVSSDERITLKELAKLFEEVSNIKLNIKWGAKPYRNREVMIPYNKGKKIPGWYQKVSIKDGLKKLIEYERSK